MLEEREYMRERRGPEMNPDKSGMKCLLGLILINAVIWLIGPALLEDLILPGGEFALKEPWRFLTAAFSHAGFTHLFFNLFGLYMFGSISARILGGKKFCSLYLTAGILGNVFWYLFNIGNPGAAVLGASGAVVGVIMATAMMMPDIQVFMLFFPVPIKLKTMAIVYAILEILMAGSGGTGGIAYLAHVGGLIGGWLFMEFFARQYISWHPLGAITGSRTAETEPPPGWTSSSYGAYTGGAVSKKDVDRVLDKLSRTGVNSLTEEEMEILRKAREQMKSGQSSRQ